jgi:hypothetical protein
MVWNLLESSPQLLEVAIITFIFQVRKLIAMAMKYKHRLKRSKQ